MSVLSQIADGALIAATLALGAVAGIAWRRQARPMAAADTQDVGEAPTAAPVPSPQPTQEDDMAAPDPDLPDILVQDAAATPRDAMPRPAGGPTDGDGPDIDRLTEVLSRIEAANAAAEARIAELEMIMAGLDDIDDTPTPSDGADTLIFAPAVTPPMFRRGADARVEVLRPEAG